ncbi:MAG: hypothetical protein QHJ73_15980 [Armatimonadota bacterium]|nr:hypothetical protein [Armatimonadota bacterium]
MPALDGTGPRGEGRGTGRGRGPCNQTPLPPAFRPEEARRDGLRPAFWSGLAAVALQFAIAYFLGGRGGGRGRWR